MKWHTTVLKAIEQALSDIFDQGYMADKVVEYTLKAHPKFGSRDRAQVAGMVYDIVRFHRRVVAASGLPQPRYMEQIGTWIVLEGHMLPDWREFARLNPNKIKALDKENTSHRVLRESIPDWLDSLGMQELPERWEREIAALNEQAELVLRVNTLKTHKKALQNALADSGVETKVLDAYPDALLVTKRSNVFRTQPFRDGWFEVQDASSQLVAPFLMAEPGMRIIDACAGGGGKSLHLAALMQNKGKIISLDVEGKKLNSLKQRAKRAGVHMIETRVVGEGKVIKRLQKSADAVLLDVPCSGLGVLRRNPDAKWKMNPDKIANIKALQADILSRYAYMAKPNGVVIYATCSLMPSENLHQVQAFLAKHEAFHLEKYREIWPSQGFDGFFMARMRRIE